MLAISSRLAPIDRTSLIGSIGTVQCDVFSIALHRQLLVISGEALQVLLVWQPGNGFGAQEIRIPDGEQTHEYGHVVLERSSAEVLVHLVKAFQEGPEVGLTDREHRRKADCRVHGV